MARTSLYLADLYQVTRIILPQLRHILALALLLSTLYHFNNFTLPFVMFGTPPPLQADVLPLFAFLTGWNDVLFASVLTSPETRTLAVQLQAFSSAQGRKVYTLCR